MTKTINPDVAAFKEDFFKGLSFRECVFGASALLTGVGGILLLHFYFGVGINTAITCSQCGSIETGTAERTGCQ